MAGPDKTPSDAEVDASAPAEEQAETRKVQIVGGSTYAVSLPKPWIDAMGVHAGDELLLRVRRDGTLSVEPRRERRRVPQVRVEKPAPTDGQEVLRLLTAHYLASTDVLVLRYPTGVTPGVRAAIEEACVRLRGLQLVEEDATSVTLQDLSDAREFNADKAVRLMHLNARRMLQDSARAIADPASRPGLYDAMARCEAELDRLLLLLLKQHRLLVRDLAFSDRVGVGPAEIIHVLNAASALERIGDVALEVAHTEHSADPERAPDLVSHVEATCQLAARALDDAMNAFHRSDVELANATIRLSADLGQLVDRIPREAVSSPKRRVVLPRCENCLGYVSIFDGYGQVGMHAKAIAEIAIDRAVAAAPSKKVNR